MPWTASEFKKRHWTAATIAQARMAASIANGLLRDKRPEGSAIAIAISRTKSPHKGVAKKRAVRKARKVVK